MITLPIKYNNLAELSDTLYRRVNLKVITLEMTQEDYDTFITDLDTLENIYVGKFRPIKIDENDNICDWVFGGGILKFKIKIK